MKTLRDFRPDAVVRLELYVDGEKQLEIDMQPAGDRLVHLGVAITNWEDFSLVDTRDLFGTARGTLTRLLRRDSNIQVDAADLETVEKEEPPF